MASQIRNSKGTVPFVKMHGLGNDYVYLDERETEVGDPPTWARILSDRHRGVGGDGLIILRRDPEHPCRMEMYNTDGSRAEMCGNGIRCVARLAYERGYSTEDHFLLATDYGPREIQVFPGTGADDQAEFLVRVGMGAAEIEGEATLEVGGRAFTGTILGLGNPHFVTEIDGSIAQYPVEKFGPLLEKHVQFPQRANIEFVQVRNRGEIDFRVWERGSGETRACGTGATAAAHALARLGKVDSKVTVHLLGGDLEIEIDGDQNWMTGPAEVAFHGSFDRALMRAES